jgi:hypothetical protein
MKRGVAITDIGDLLIDDRLILENQMFDNQDRYKKDLAFELWKSFDLVFDLNDFMREYLEKQ